MLTKYPRIAQSGFELRNDLRGKAVHAARVAVDTGRTRDPDLLEALDDLESIVELALATSPGQDSTLRIFESHVRDTWWAHCAATDDE